MKFIAREQSNQHGIVDLVEPVRLTPKITGQRVRILLPPNIPDGSGPISDWAVLSGNQIEQGIIKDTRVELITTRYHLFGRHLLTTKKLKKAQAWS